jgi:hypothetical protein
MKIGDLVTYAGHRWKVAVRNSQYRTCTLARPDGPSVEVPDDMDYRPLPDRPKLEVICHLATEWPFIAAPVRPRSGPVVKITRRRQDLMVMYDWVPSDFLRPGGSIFLNPELHLRQGEVLAATHQDKSLSRMVVTATFGTIKRRIAQQNKPKSAPRVRTVYDHLMDDPFEDK